MKTICVFLVCVLAVTVAEKAGEDISIAKEVAECKKELGITEWTSLEIAESMEDATTDDKKSCLVSCLFKKKGMLNENGSFNKAALLDRTLASKKELVEKAMENCEKTITPTNGCKLVTCLMQAVNTMSNSGNGKREKTINL